MNDRSGFTLTELLITMSAGSALMILAVGLVLQSMHLTTAARRGADEHRTMARLASQFRADVRMADRVVVDSGSEIRITIPQRGEVTYVAQPAACVRTTADASVEDTGSQDARENYPLQPGALVRFEALEQPSRAALVLSRDSIVRLHGAESRPLATNSLDSSPPETLRVEAVIGAVGHLLDAQSQEAAP